MDIKAKIEELVARIRADRSLQSRFKDEPVEVVEELLGVNLPEEQINPVVDGVKARLGFDAAVGDNGDGLLDKAKDLFGKD